MTAARPLRQVLARRVAGTAVATLVVLMAVMAAVVVALRERADERWLRDASEHLAQQTQRVEGEWVRQAELLRSQIEFMGLMDEADDRVAAARLIAYLASQGGVGTFTQVTVRDGQGAPLARYGTRSSLDEPARRADGPWLHVPAEGLLYRVMRASLRLGPRGVGELELHVPVNNALLNAIAFPGTALSLHWGSLDDLAVSALYTRAAEHQAEPLDSSVGWAGMPGGVQLHVTRAGREALPLAEIALAAAGTGACGLLAWLAIGHWARRHVRHIDAVTGAVDEFAAHRTHAGPLDARLTAATRDADLEVQRLAGGIVAMMHTTEAADNGQSAARARLEELNATLEQRVEARTRELEVARDEALAAARARQQIMAGVSHELRTPLVGLLGSLDLLAVERMTPDQQRLIEVARRSGGALRTVIDDVLDYSRLEAVGATLRQMPMRADEVAAEAVALHAAVALQKGLRLQCQADAAAAAPVLGDPARLRQVLLNLVGNAVKFTDHGSVDVTVAAHEGPPPDRLVLHFCVRDSGPGMDADTQARLFSPFVQAADAHRGGTGLGLAIAQRLVVAMGGRIEVQSTPGSGSRFVFELALPPAGRAPQSGPAPAATTLQGRVLLVEDNPVNRMVAGEMLRRLGLKVEEAENGLLALEVLRQRPADLVLMDQQMPVLDGLAATARIRRGDAGEAMRTVPIVAVTANAMSEDIERCLGAGMNGHLAKPFTPVELAACLGPWLPAAAIKAG